MILKLFPIVAALIAGSMIAFQSPINAKLGNFMGGSLVAAFCSFATGTIILGLILILTGNLPRISEMQNTTLWMWAGGLLGAIFVSISISVVPILGSALMISLFVTGQLLGALAIDKTGFLLPTQTDIGWERILAVCLIISGVLLFMRSRGGL